MALVTSLALLMFAQAPAQAPAQSFEQVDVALNDLANGRNSAAIERIEGNDRLDQEDPARLINLGIAYARKGNEDMARNMFSAAANNRDRYDLEMASGQWMDSRELARQALDMLARGEFVSAGRVAAR